MNNAIVLHHQQYEVSDIERMARALTVSKLFGVTNIEQAIALCLVAQAEGRHPASAAQDYHIIQGRPAKKADSMLRDFITAGGKVQWHELTDTIADATFSHPSGGSVRITWDIDRAQNAGLFFIKDGKRMRSGRNGPEVCMWEKYPRPMLRARVVSEGVRTVFPMATSGMYVPEEVVEFAEQPKEIEAQREQITADGEIIEAEPVKKPSKAKNRDAYREFSAEIAACQTVEELVALWASPVAQETLKGLPEDWRDNIIAEKDARKAELTGTEDSATDHSGFVPPNFDRLGEDEQPPF